MNLSVSFHYDFYPVGQGLFSSGVIRRQDGNQPHFLWVYDCGSSSGDRFIEKSVQRLAITARGRNRIDLLTLSHFDHDHISGVVRLLRDFKVGVLMLPYMTLTQRLVLAFEEGHGDAGDPLFNFFFNPVEFLLAQEGPGIERILFVPPSGSEGSPYPGEIGPPEDLGPDAEPRVEADTGKRENDWDTEALRQAGNGGIGNHASVEYLRPGGRLVVRSCQWEFIPYNDDSDVEITEVFVRLVEEERGNLLSSNTGGVKERSLRNLKSAYAGLFGNTSEEKNIISLFMYSGPIYRSWNEYVLLWGESHVSAQLLNLRGGPFLRPRGWISGIAEDDTQVQRCSILYSGDGYLDSGARLKNLTEYLDERRVQKVGVFQVMHHGAESNWRQGVAPAIAPIFSIFSSDPERKKWKHPHAPVLREFWRYGAVQVDKTSDFHAGGALRSW